MKFFRSIVLSAIVLSLALPTLPANAQEGSEKCLQAYVHELTKKLQKRGWIGMSLTQTDDKIVVAALAQEGPARKGGFREKDAIVSMNGTKYSSLDELAKASGKFKVGDILNYVVMRDGKEEELDVLLTEATAPVIGLWIGEHIIAHYVPVEGDMVKFP